MSRLNKAFTLIEILVGLSVSATIFVIATNLVVNIYTSSLKGKQIEVLAQVKNDLQAEFGNSVRWADSISYAGGIFQVDSTNYSLQNGRLFKEAVPLSPEEVEITNFEVDKYENQTTSSSGSALSGSGLTTQYFNNADFTGSAFTQTDFVIDFDWGVGSPDPLIDSNTFSMRASGQLETEVAQEYTFYVASDEGARLWIDGSLVINDWDIPGYAEVLGKIYLSPGKHDIRLDYFENFGAARISLFWSYPGRTKQIIPVSNLYPKSGPVSLEIVIEMKLKGSSSIVDSLKLTLSPRSGNISTIE